MRSYISRTSRLILVAFLVLFLALLALMLTRVILPDMVGNGADWIKAILIGMCVVISLRVLGRKGPQLIVDDEGIHHLQQHGFGLIPWDDIRGVSIATYRGMRLLRIDVVDPEKYREPLRRVNRDIARAGAALGSAGPLISLRGLSPGIDEVWEYLVREYPERIAGVTN